MVSITTPHTTLRKLREYQMKKRKEETGPLSQGVQEGGKALRIRHLHGVEVREKRPRGFKIVSPLSPYQFLPGVLEEGGPSLVDCMVVVWCLYGGCMVILKVRSFSKVPTADERDGLLVGPPHAVREGVANLTGFEGE
jgi:hypothetical protein